MQIAQVLVRAYLFALRDGQGKIVATGLASIARA